MIVWHMMLTKADLVLATSGARRVDTWRKRRADRAAFPLIIAAHPFGGLSFRSDDAAVHVPANGAWPSPIRVAGAVLWRLAPRLDGTMVTLVYADRQLVLGRTLLPAEEV